MQISEIRNIEVFLIQCVVYLLLWLISEYTATLITSIIVPILIGVLVIAGLAELIDRSKISTRYFHLMILSILAPVVVAICYGFIIGFNYDWPGIG